MEATALLCRRGSFLELATKTLFAAGQLGGDRIPRFTLLLKLKGVRLALDARLALACVLKDDFLDATAISIGSRSPKPPCVGVG